MVDTKMNQVHMADISQFFMYCSMAGLKVELHPMPYFNGYVCICKDDEGNRLWDVACNDCTYGNKLGLLEGMGGPFVTEDDEVTGWLTYQDALEMVLPYMQSL